MTAKTGGVYLLVFYFLYVYNIADDSKILANYSIFNNRNYPN